MKTFAKVFMGIAATLALSTGVQAAQIGQMVLGTLNITDNSGTSDTFSASNVAVTWFFQTGAVCNAGCGALFTFSGTTTTAATLSGSTLDEQGIHGSFSIIGTGAFAGQNFLSGTFGGVTASQGDASGTNGGTGLTLGDSTVSQDAEIVMTSSFFNLTPDESFSIGVSNLVNALSRGSGNFLANNSGSAVGTFNAAQVTQTFTPEPATMALLGSALLGLGLIRRRRKV